MSPRGAREPHGDPTQRPSLPEQGLDVTGERGTASSRPSASRIDPFSPAGIAMRELMKTQTVERSQWRTRAIWFVVAVLAGAILAAVLSAIN